MAVVNVINAAAYSDSHHECCGMGRGPKLQIARIEQCGMSKQIKSVASEDLHHSILLACLRMHLPVQYCISCA